MLEIGANPLKIFNMRLYKEKRNFEVNLRCAFFLCHEVLLSAVKNYLNLKFIQKVLCVPPSGQEIMNQRRKTRPQYSQKFGSLSTTSLTRFCLEVEGNFKRTVIQLLRNGQSFPRVPRNGRATNECSLSQAKRRVLGHTVMEKSNHEINL